jgi:hypothetical protein
VARGEPALGVAPAAWGQPSGRQEQARGGRNRPALSSTRGGGANRSYALPQGPGPELVAETVLRIAASKTPRLRYMVGQQAKLVTRLRRFLPEPVFERGVRSTFQLDRKG